MTPIDYPLIDVVHFTDGDTLWVRREWHVGEVDGVELIARDYLGGVCVRLTDGIEKTDRGLNTPERGKPGYKEAGVNLQDWIHGWQPDELILRAWGKDEFGRVLGNILPVDPMHPDDGGVVAYMRDVLGWPAYR